MANKRKRKQNRNVVQFQRTVFFNAATIVFAVFFIYVVGSVMNSLKKEPVSIYRVSSSDINNNITCTGIALREENEVSSSKTGYLSYFVRDGEKVRKSSPVCTVDETGNLIAAISMGTNDKVLFDSSDYQEIRSSIDTFKISYKDEEFYNVKNFRGTIESKILELSNEVLMSEYQTQGASIQSTVENISSPFSGIVSYYVDGFENKTAESLKEEDFDKSKYEKTSLKTGEIINSGSTIFKILPSENWTICCKLTKEQANTILEEDDLTFTINNSETEITSTYDMIQMENSTFIVLSLKKYMVDYIDERFLSIEFILNRYEGLKVPNSSIIEKEVYKIPAEYMTSGSNEDDYNNKVMIPVTKEDGSESVEAVRLTIYRTEDTNEDGKAEFYLVDKSTLENTSKLIAEGIRHDSIAISELEKTNIKGVYFANEGIAEFMPVTIVKVGDEFTIVKDKENLLQFDNIVMDSSSVTENQTIY